MYKGYGVRNIVIVSGRKTHPDAQVNWIWRELEGLFGLYVQPGMEISLFCLADIRCQNLY